MTTHRNFRRGAFFAAILGLIAGCNQGASKQNEKQGDKAEGKAATEGAASSGDVCEDYAKKLCEKLGEQSPTCNAAKQTAAVMAPSACKAGIGDIAVSETKIKEMGKVCTELSTKLCNDIGADTQSCAMVKEQTPKFPPERCTAMMAQYDKVLADLKKREEANKPLDSEKRKAIEENAVATFGPEDAKVTVVEFSDFQCPFCSRAATAVTEIKKKYEGKGVRFIFRQFPLSFHKDAHLAAQASLEAAKQGKFWEFHDTLFGNQKELKRENLEAHAKKVGLDVAAFKKALDDKKLSDAVEADMKLGELVAVSGTPTMFVNGKRVQNPTDASSISTLIDAELAN